MTIAFDVQGDGTPLVLLHGLGSRRGVWGPVVGALAHERRIYAVDLPGFGASPPEDFEPGPHEYAGVLGDWLAEQGLERPHVAGNSMGGAIALELARAGLVASATAISPVGFWTPRELRFVQISLRASRAIAERLHPMLPAVAGSPVGRSVVLAQMRSRPWRVPEDEVVAEVEAFVAAPWVEPALQALGRYRFHDGDQLRGVPVTIAWGTRDALLIPRQAARARRMLPWARHVALRGCGHLPFHDDPDAVVAVLLSGSLPVDDNNW